MTPKTRWRVLACLVAVGLSIPAESVLLKAISATDPQQAVQQWAASLSITDLDAAANQIQSYPLLYRRGILRALSPTQRARVWRAHVQLYLGTHPDLDAGAVDALQTAVALITPESMGTATAEERAGMNDAAARVSALLGPDTASYLFYRLGPRDGTFASLEPISQRLATFVRRHTIVFAGAEDCDCAVDFGCDNYSTFCNGNVACAPDTTWPMCGWFWNEPCDGLCYAGVPR